MEGKEGQLETIEVIIEFFYVFLDALASLDSKLSVSQSVTFSASASTGLSELFF